MFEFASSPDLFRRTLEELPIGMVLVSPTGDLLVINRALGETLGYEPTALRALTYAELGHPEDFEDNKRLFKGLLSGEHSSDRRVVRLTCADGSVVYGDMSTVLMRDDDGTPMYFVAQILDITEQHDDLDRLEIAHAELAEAHEKADKERRRLEAIFETVDVGLLLIDREGRYERMNRRHAETLALPFPRGHRGRAGQLGDVFHPDQVTPFTKEEMPSHRAAAGEEFDDLRLWVGADPITRLAYSISARNVRDAQGDMVGAAMAYKDITDLMRALQVKDEFVASVSHELRTPLTSVLGHLEILADRTDLPEDVTRQLSVVERNALRLRALVSDLLHAASVRGGGVQLVRSEVDLASVVTEAVEAARPTADASQVALEATLPELLVAVVDPQRIRQVLDNLLSNAIKYADPGGRASIELTRRLDRIEITISDTGIGISPEDMERLFTKFFRGELARARQVPGTGLGLPIVQAIAEAHEGEVRVSSELGRGSTFVLSIPYVEPNN